VPEARDCTRHSGLFDADGELKAWGRLFGGMGPRVKANLPVDRLPVVTFDPEPLILGSVDAYEALDAMIFRRRTEGDFRLSEA